MSKEDTRSLLFGFADGDVMLDARTLIGAVGALQTRKGIFALENRTSLIQFVEALVLHERIFVDRVSYEYKKAYDGLDVRELGVSNIVIGILPPGATPLQEPYNENLGDIPIEHYYRQESVERAARYSLFEDDVREVVKYAEEILPGLSIKLREESKRIASEPIKGLGKYKDEEGIAALVVRALYYYGIANQFGLAYTPHIFRAPVIKKHLLAMGNTEVPPNFADTFVSFLFSLASAKIDELNDLLGKPFFKLDVPVVFNYVLKKAKRRRDIINVALEIRNESSAESFRREMSAFDRAVKENDASTIVEGLQSLQQHLRNLGKSLEAPSIGLELGFPLSIAIDPVTAVTWLREKRKRHLVFIGDVYKDAIRSQGLWAQIGKMPY